MKKDQMTNGNCDFLSYWYTRRQLKEEEERHNNQLQVNKHAT